MSLPTYRQVHDALPPGIKGVAIPMKRPTRRGLGHFVAKSWYDAIYEPLKTPEWKMLWMADVYAYHFLLEELRVEFRIRLPADTFMNDAARVRFLLRHPDIRKDDPDARRALRWAHS